MSAWAVTSKPWPPRRHARLSRKRCHQLSLLVAVDRHQRGAAVADSLPGRFRKAAMPVVQGDRHDRHCPVLHFRQQGGQEGGFAGTMRADNLAPPARRPQFLRQPRDPLTWRKEKRYRAGADTALRNGLAATLIPAPHPRAPRCLAGRAPRPPTLDRREQNPDARTAQPICTMAPS